MLERIVEVADDNRHLSLKRGFLVVTESSKEHEEVGRVPIDDIGAVIAHAQGLTYTNNILVALAERGVPFVLCGANHQVVGMLISVDGNFQQAKRFDAQIGATKPLMKRLWADIVRAKLQQQASVLAAVNVPTAPLLALIKKVRSGDVENIEAQGARRYWNLLFGDEFRRDRDQDGINALLNYGYTVIRAATARAIVAAGLHPTIGLFHSNQGNAMRLVDDVMEPFRPIIDIKVWHLVQQGMDSVNSETKRLLVKTLYEDMDTLFGVTPVMVCIQRLSTSLAQVFIGEKEKLDFPLPNLPLNLQIKFDE